MDILLSGKVAMADEPNSKYLRKLGLAQPIAYKSLSFEQKLNTNSTLDFILNNLK